MKKVNYFLIFTTLLIIGLSISSLQINQAFGQTSSSSSGTIATSTSSGTATTSTSSGTATTSTSSGTAVITEPSTSSGTTITTSSGSTPSSSGTSTATVSQNFTGIWQAKLEKTVTINGTKVKEASRNITLKLCVSDNKVKGIILHPGFFKRAIATTDTVVSETEVKLNLKDITGRTGKLTLVLNGEQLNGTFESGVVIVAIRRSILNPQRACALIGLFEGLSGEPTSSTPSPSPTPSPTPGMSMNGPAGPEGNPGNMTGFDMGGAGMMLGMDDSGPGSEMNNMGGMDSPGLGMSNMGGMGIF